MSAADIKSIIADRIIELCEKENTLPWVRPWRSMGGYSAANLDTKKPYRGANAIMLMMAPYASPWYLTIRQMKDRNVMMRKGEKPWPIYFCKFPRKGETNPKTGKELFPIVRYYKVWNTEQLNGEVKVPKPAIELKDHDPIEACEKIIASYENGPSIGFGGDRAYYRPSDDHVQLPLRAQFKTAEEYYSTAFHELSHSTGSEKRLARDGITDMVMFGNHKYANEELVAEFGAAMLCAQAGIEKASLIENSAAYIKHWLTKMKEDKVMLFNAAQKAQRAADMIRGMKWDAVEEEEEEVEVAA